MQLHRFRIERIHVRITRVIWMLFSIYSCKIHRTLFLSRLHAGGIFVWSLRSLAMICDDYLSNCKRQVCRLYTEMTSSQCSHLVVLIYKRNQQDAPISSTTDTEYDSSFEWIDVFMNLKLIRRLNKITINNVYQTHKFSLCSVQVFSKTTCYNHNNLNTYPLNVYIMNLTKDIVKWFIHIIFYWRLKSLWCSRRLPA